MSPTSCQLLYPAAYLVNPSPRTGGCQAEPGRQYERRDAFSAPDPPAWAATTGLPQGRHLSAQRPPVSQAQHPPQPNLHGRVDGPSCPAQRAPYRKTSPSGTTVSQHPARRDPAPRQSSPTPGAARGDNLAQQAPAARNYPPPAPPGSTPGAACPSTRKGETPAPGYIPVRQPAKPGRLPAGLGPTPSKTGLIAGRTEAYPRHDHVQHSARRTSAPGTMWLGEA